MKARLATIFTLLALVGGTGGALALAGSGGNGQVRSAAASQYKKPHPGCHINGHYYKHCPRRYPHHFHCYFRGHYYKKCPYGKGVKGVHAVRHRRHHRSASFTG